MNTITDLIGWITLVALFAIGFHYTRKADMETELDEHENHLR